MPTFFLDENVQGPRFADVLTNAGITIELCRDHGFDGVDDTIWIPAVAQRGWVIVTGDTRTRRDRWEKAAIVHAGARMIHVVMRNATHGILAQNFVNTYDTIERTVQGVNAPLLATLTRPKAMADVFAGRPGSVRLQKLHVR